MNQDQAPTEVVALPKPAVRDVAAWLARRLAAWLRAPVDHEGSYGVRVYRSGSVLGLHCDSLSTSALAAIVHVRQRTPLATSWPLEIRDHAGQWQSVLLTEPGQVLLYEGAKLPHGRPEPLNGTEFANLFFYFRPRVGWAFGGGLV